MPIAQSKYVSITSGIGGASAASRKDLGLRLLTTNALFPTNTVLEFTSAADVGNYAGTQSTEYKLAQAYFGRVSKSATVPNKISFMYAPFLATACSILSTIEITPATLLTTFQAITDGEMTISMGGVSLDLTGLDFSAATSLADVAQVIQTAINANTAGGTLFTNATVEFDAVLQAFKLTGGATGENVITYATSVTAGSGTDISGTIGWDEASSPILSDGIDAEDIAEILNDTVELSDNFGSFAFIGLTLDASNVAKIGGWNSAQNFDFMFCGDVTDTNYATVIETAKGYAGMAINYQPYADALPAYLMPATIFASTNYGKINGTVNYMYQQFPAQAVTVDTNALANTLDPLFINYNGQTQKAGSKIEFYQDGFLADGTDMAVYANEIWFKDAMKTEILNLEVASEKIPANDDGIAAILGVLQAVAGEAVNNGTISVGKDLTNTQKAYITQLTGDNTAWQTIELNGYIINIELKTSVVNGATKYIAEYQLIYSKGDSIRKVEGTHILI